MYRITWVPLSLRHNLCTTLKYSVQNRKTINLKISCVVKNLGGKKKKYRFCLLNFKCKWIEVKMRSSGDPNPVKTGVLLRRGGDTGRRPPDTGRDWSGAPISQGASRTAAHTEAERKAWGMFSQEPARGAQPWGQFDSWLLTFRTVSVNFCCFKPPSLW